MGDTFVYAIPMCKSINGVTVVQNGDYLIFINSNKCPDKQQEALRHELEHIERGHLYDEVKLIGDCENEVC